MNCIRCSTRALTLAGAVAAWLSLSAAAPAFGADEVNATSGLTASGAPLALHGFDPVAYFSDAAPTPGSAAYASVYEGATYYFASEENLETFEAKPAKYVPAYGGFCAYGVSVGKKFDGNPRYWKVVDGRLYLNLNADIARQFADDLKGSIAKAEKSWTRIVHARVEDL